MSDELDDIVQQLETEAESLPEKQNRCIQHLIELGYLPLSMANALSPAQIEQAKIAFLEDAVGSSMFSLTEIQLLSTEDENAFLVNLLWRATDIDEGFQFTELPKVGEKSLRSRIVHFRLDIFGLWMAQIGQPFDIVNSKAALQKLAEFTNCSELEALNLAGDVEQLTAKLLKTHQEEDFILTIKPRHEIDKNIQRRLDRTRKFKNQLIEDFGERTDFFKYLNKEILKNNPRKVDFNFLIKEKNNVFKQFVLRLIQIHQWQEGFYNGLLDSDIGEVTINSILKAIELYNLADNRKIHKYRVLTHIVDDYYLFNGLFFLQEYMLEKESVENPEEQIISDLMQNVEHANDQDLNAFQLHMSVIKSELAFAAQQKPVERKGFLQRVYFGVKKFFKKIVKISKKIFQWVVFLADRFKDILHKIFGKLFEKLATGIKAFITGLKFLLGRQETITTNPDGLIVSAIRLDGDCYNIQSGTVSPKLVTSHNENVRYHVRALNFSLTLVGGVLKIVMNAISVITWPMLLMTIIKTVQRISESYQKLNIETN